MKAVYCDWPECEHWERDITDPMVYGGRCIKEVIRMYRGPVHSKTKIIDPPTCSWYTERKEGTGPLAGTGKEENK